jgi:hypothetical protein
LARLDPQTIFLKQRICKNLTSDEISPDPASLMFDFFAGLFILVINEGGSHLGNHFGLANL